MATPRLDSSLQEYDLTEEEILTAQLLNPILVMYLQTKFSLYFKQKAATLIPTDSLDDRDFLLTMGKLEGKLELLTELFDECRRAKEELANPARIVDPTKEQPVLREIGSAESRAAQLVHQVSN